VLELLLLDPGNPRSLVYQLERLNEDLEALPRASRSRLRPEPRLALDASTMLRLADPAELGQTSAEGSRVELAKLLDRMVDRLLAVGAAVDSEHFVHTAPTFSFLGAAGTEPTIIKGR
jgi:uncharacterized alpha-E superfamily protein